MQHGFVFQNQPGYHAYMPNYQQMPTAPPPGWVPDGAHPLGPGPPPAYTHQMPVTVIERVGGIGGIGMGLGARPAYYQRQYFYNLSPEQQRRSLCAFLIVFGCMFGFMIFAFRRFSSFHA